MKLGLILTILAVIFICEYSRYDNLRILNKKISVIKANKNYSSIAIPDYNCLRIIEEWSRHHSADSFIGFIKNWKNRPKHSVIDMNDRKATDILNYLNNLKSVPLYDGEGRIIGFSD